MTCRKINLGASSISLSPKISPKLSPGRARRVFISEPDNDDALFSGSDQPGIRTGCPAPGFVARTIANGERQGLVNLDEYIGKTCVVIFFCPVDLNFVVPQEVLAFSDSAQRFRNQGCEVIVLSTDSEIRLKTLTRTSREHGGLGTLDILLGMDKGGKIARRYGSVNANSEPIRGVFLVSSSGVICRAATDILPVGWPIVEETLKLLESSFGKELKIAVNKPFRSCAFLDVKSSETVENVKRKVGVTSKGWSALFHNGRRLKDGSTLAACSIQNGAALTIVETSDVMICVAFPPPNGVDVVWSSPTETIETFKRTIERLRGFPVSDQKLFFGGRELSELSKTLGDYGIAKESLIQVTILRRSCTPPPGC